MPERRNRIDVLWLIEHIAREMDVACAAAAIARSRYGLDITVRNIYYHAEDNLKSYHPRVVIHPFFYHLKDALATEDYVASWPDAIHFNLAWEQIHYGAHKTIKAPADEFTRKHVIHHAWGSFYEEYLLAAGVDSKNIFLNGQPAYQLYKSPYRNYFKNRTRLSQLYNLDPRARWVFIPENYRWAFIENKLNYFKKLGGNENEMMGLKAFCTESLKEVLRWCNSLADRDGIAVIFRPRPSINLKLYTDFCLDHVGPLRSNFRLIKGESVREWILASDIIVSSYSTSLIEASIAEKPVYMVEPEPIPGSLHCGWYDLVPRIRSSAEFEDACLQPGSAQKAGALQAWAEREMLSTGDPINRIVDFVKTLVDRKSEGHVFFQGEKKVGKKRKKYFNEVTHENDIFSEIDIQQRIEAWQRSFDETENSAGNSHSTLEFSREPINGLARRTAPASTFLSVIVCTLNRSRQLSRCLESLSAQLADKYCFEVIVVDNNSEDDTSDVVLRHAERNSDVRYVKEEQLGLSYARNRGCDEARGSYLVFLDDDAMVPKDYLFQLLGVIQKHSPDIIGGPVFPYYDTPKPRWFKDEYEIKRFEDSSGFSATCRVTGANFTIRKDVLVKLGKFDVNLGMKGNQLRLGEERAVLESYRRQTPLAQQKVYYALEVYVNHYVPDYKMTLRYRLRRSFQGGRDGLRILREDSNQTMSRAIKSFPLKILADLREICSKGIGNADYVKILLNVVTRFGIMVQLVGTGLTAILRVHPLLSKTILSLASKKTKST